MLCLVLDRIEMLWGRCWGAGEQFPKNKENKEDASCSGIFCFHRSIWTIIRDGKLNVWSHKETTNLLRCKQSISLFPWIFQQKHGWKDGDNMDAAFFSLKLIPENRWTPKLKNIYTYIQIFFREIIQMIKVFFFFKSLAQVVRFRLWSYLIR